MLSNRPYLLRAFHDWIVDSNCTPILVADANYPDCRAPQEYAEDGEFAFSLSQQAIRDLKITATSVNFIASFNGIVHMVSLPLESIVSLYAEENGEGIYFDEEDEGEGTEDEDQRIVRSEIGLSLVDVNHHDGVNDASTDSSISSSQKKKPILKLIE